MVSKDRSTNRLIQSQFDLNRWLSDAPSVEDARPACCPSCGEASRPLGRPLVIIGHGRRHRQQRGPRAPDGAPTEIDVQVRRYRCKACCAVITVAPPGMLRRRLYSSSAIAWALALFGVLLLPPALIRQRVSPWQLVGHTAKTGWAQLRRWTSAVRHGALFTATRRCPEEWSDRQVAERCAAHLAATAPPIFGSDLATCAFYGAVQTG